MHEREFNKERARRRNERMNSPRPSERINSIAFIFFISGGV
jgi:hypothetical protein